MSDFTMFPYVLARIAAEPYADLQKTEVPVTSALVVKIADNKAEMHKLGQIISDELYTAIPQITESFSRRFLIALRRDIHNQRTVSSTSQHLSVLPKPLQSKIRRYIRLQTTRLSLIETAERQYYQEIVTSRQGFATLLQKPNLQNGLLLSSATINSSLHAYLNSDSSFGKPTAVTKQERSFMEYLSRMYTKPSPFSSFTYLSMAGFSDTQRHALVDYSTSKIISHIHLNHDLYGYLYDLLVNRPEIRNALVITLNPTVKKTEDTYHFLANHHNSEAFQHITGTPALDILAGLVAQASRPVTQGQLVQEVVTKKYIRASADEIETYLDQLVGLGFFELDLGISGVDLEWNKKLSQQLLRLAPEWPPTKQIIQGLATLKEQAAQYKTAATDKRTSLLDQALQTFKATCEAAGATVPQTEEKTPARAKAAGSKKDKIFRRTYSTEFMHQRHRLWYEDTILSEQAELSTRLKPNMDSLSDLLARMGRFDGCSDEPERMVEFFKTTYQSSSSIDLLKFYKDYIEYKKTSKERTARLTVRRRRANQDALDIFCKNVGERAFTDEVRISKQDIAHLQPTASQASFGAYLHVYEAANGPQLVLNGDTTPGNGKMLSRFLYLFDDKVTEELRRPYATEHPEVLFAEVTDASFFNANLHPPIMPYEILTPAGHGSLPAAGRLNVTDLAVICKPKSRRLTLVHVPSQKEVVVFDIGLEGHGGRSKLYGLLSNFGPGSHYHVATFRNSINNARKEVSDTSNPDIVVLPRITYEDQVVLQRKTWEITKKIMPVRTAPESDGAYFVRLNIWRREIGIPDEVFVQLGHHKPQYISFRNPFLVAVWQSIVRGWGGKDTLQITEMLPRPDQLGPTNGRVVELFAQWRNN